MRFSIFISILLFVFTSCASLIPIENYYMEDPKIIPYDTIKTKTFIMDSLQYGLVESGDTLILNGNVKIREDRLVKNRGIISKHKITSYKQNANYMLTLSTLALGGLGIGTYYEYRDSISGNKTTLDIAILSGFTGILIGALLIDYYDIQRHKKVIDEVIQVDTIYKERNIEPKFYNVNNKIMQIEIADEKYDSIEINNSSFSLKLKRAIYDINSMGYLKYTINNKEMQAEITMNNENQYRIENYNKILQEEEKKLYKEKLDKILKQARKNGLKFCDFAKYTYIPKSGFWVDTSMQLIPEDENLEMHPFFDPDAEGVEMISSAQDLADLALDGMKQGTAGLSLFGANVEFSIDKKKTYYAGNNKITFVDLKMNTQVGNLMQVVAHTEQYYVYNKKYNKGIFYIVTYHDGTTYALYKNKIHKIIENIKFFK